MDDTPQPRLIATLTDFKTLYGTLPVANVWQSVYFDRRTPALGISEGPGAPIEYTASVNLAGSGEFPREGHVFIKDWEENEGVRAALEAAGVIGPATRVIMSGYVTVTEHEILAKGEAL